MKEKLQRFMAGRYGTDQLSRVYLVITLILLVLSMFSKFLPLYWVALRILIYTYYRMLSRNVSEDVCPESEVLKLALSYDREMECI